VGKGVVGAFVVRAFVGTKELGTKEVGTPVGKNALKSHVGKAVDGGEVGILVGNAVGVAGARVSGNVGAAVGVAVILGASEGDSLETGVGGELPVGAGDEGAAVGTLLGFDDASLGTLLGT
jgi:hypothetical protein